MSFEQAVADRFEGVDRELLKLNEGLSQMARALLDQSRDDFATERLILATAALVARDSADALGWLDQARALAFGPSDDAELQEGRERIELLFAKLEGAVVRRLDSQTPGGAAT